MITEIDEIVRLSSFWTIRRVMSEVQVLTNLTNTDNVQQSNIRTHLNSNLSNLWTLLNSANIPWYQICMTGELEATLHISGLHYLKLNNPDLVDVNNVPFNPATMLQRIKEVSFVGNGVDTDWIGTVTHRDKGDLSHLINEQNEQWYQAIAFDYYSSYILFFIGKDIQTAAVSRSNPYYDVSAQKVAIWGVRKPLLDSMKALNDAESDVDKMMDFPDEHMDLLIKMTVQKVLMQMDKQVPAEIENAVNAGIQNITTMIDQTIMKERMIKEGVQIAKPQTRFYPQGQ